MPPVQHVAQDSSTISKGGPAELQGEELRTLLTEAADVFADYVNGATSDSGKAITEASAQQLLTTLDLGLGETGVGHEGIWQDIGSICDSAAHTWNKGFLFKLFASPTPIGVIGESLTALLNNNSHVYESSPAGTVLEATVGAKLAAMANFPAETAAGLTFP
ncbi:Glutamate decarboxylase 2, partial [Linderina macrospora]